MEIIKNIEQSDYGIEAEVFFRYFKKYISLSIEDDNLEFARKCADYLNEISDDLVCRLCEASIRYCNAFLSAVGEEVKTFENPIDILSLIYPSVLIVPYPENDQEPVIHMELNCEWEAEHGMEWVVRGNKVLYVGPFNGMDPWSKFDKQEPGNYA